MNILVNWITIHQSNQLKGIASDKYLACKYVKLKLGRDLCQHRIGVYNDIKELNIEDLYKLGDIVLKISNSCWKAQFFSNKTNKEEYKEQIEQFQKLYYKADHGLVEYQFFHLYAKKRIVVEKQFNPLKDLYEFKFYIINNYVKFIYFRHLVDNNIKFLIYDSNYNFIYKPKDYTLPPLNLKNIFKNNTLEEIKKLAIKLSEDFPNFIRVDLYLFHGEIYLSELTFASANGLYDRRREKYITDSMKNFSMIDNYY